MTKGGGRLEATAVTVWYEGVRALDQVDLALGEGEILGLIGPNGAGKTTLVNVLSGFHDPTDGRILMCSDEITGWSPQRRVRAGLARTFQNVRIFRDLSLFDNVLLGGLGTGVTKRTAVERAEDLLQQFDLAAYAYFPAASLSYGQERRLGIARALATRPRFLMLDEPAAGLNEVETDALGHLLREIINSYGCGMLLIEHDMRLIMSQCDRIQVLSNGKTIRIGTPADIQADEAVTEAYLGRRRKRLT